MKIRRFLIAGAVMLSCGGCQLGNLTATNIRAPLIADGVEAPKPSGVFIDAKQRVILTGSVSEKKDGKDVYRPIVCTEPSPDVFSSIAAEAGLNISGLSKSFVAQGGINEAAANIGLRTQTITLLRDSNFQPCLGRLNGSDQVQYDMMMRRSQNNIAGLLAIEQLTGAVRGANAAVSATSGGGMDMKAFYTFQSSAAQIEKDKVDAELAKLKEEKTALGKEDEVCKSSSVDKCTDDAKKARKDRQSEIEQLSTALTARSSALQAKKQALDTLAKDAANPKDGAASGITMTPDLPVVNAGMADAVKEITLSMINRDYTLQMCFDYSRAGMLGLAADTLNAGEVDAAKVASAFCRDVMGAAADQFDLRTGILSASTQTYKRLLEKAVSDGKIDAKEIALLNGVAGLVSGNPLMSALVKNGGGMGIESIGPPPITNPE